MGFNEDAFKIEFNNIPPQKGSVLISEPFLQDSYFQRSVIFLTEHSETGSMGFVLNKNLDISLNELVKGISVNEEIPVFLGGPVNVDTLFFIHTLKFIRESYRVTDTIYLNGDFDMLKDYINNGGEVEGKIKFFFGYSGWEKKQLMDELKENSWLVGGITDKDMLSTDNKKVWEKALSALGEKYKKWTKFPKDPTLN
jgi:putative transcriptional regulator